MFTCLSAVVVSGVSLRFVSFPAVDPCTDDFNSVMLARARKCVYIYIFGLM
jgi:hypothetical protein